MDVIDIKYIQNMFKEDEVKVAIIGSRNLTVDNLEKYLPSDVTEIVSGAARGIDTYAC